MRKYFLVVVVLLIALAIVPLVGAQCPSGCGGGALEDGHTVSGGLGGAFFSPSDIDGLVLWLDFSSDQVFQQSDGTVPAGLGDVIGYVGDLSGNGNHAIQAAGAWKFTRQIGPNGLYIGRADGTDDRLQTAAFAAAVAQPDMIFVALSIDATATDVFVFDGQGAANRQFLMYRPASTRFEQWAGGASILWTESLPLSFSIFSLKYDGVSSEAWQDGVSVATGNPGPNSLGGLTLGTRHNGQWPIDADFTEVLVYDPALSDSNRQQVESYLSNKWGIALASAPRDYYYALRPTDYLAFAFGAVERGHAKNVEVATR